MPKPFALPSRLTNSLFTTGCTVCFNVASSGENIPLEPDPCNPRETRCACASCKCPCALTVALEKRFDILVELELEKKERQRASAQTSQNELRFFNQILPAMVGTAAFDARRNTTLSHEQATSNAYSLVGTQMVTDPDVRDQLGIEEVTQMQQILGPPTTVARNGSMDIYTARTIQQRERQAAKAKKAANTTAARQNGPAADPSAPPTDHSATIQRMPLAPGVLNERTAVHHRAHRNQLNAPPEAAGRPSVERPQPVTPAATTPLLRRAQRGLLSILGDPSSDTPTKAKAGKLLGSLKQDGPTAIFENAPPDTSATELLENCAYAVSMSPIRRR